MARLSTYIMLKKLFRIASVGITYGETFVYIKTSVRPLPVDSLAPLTYNLGD